MTSLHFVAMQTLLKSVAADVHSSGILQGTLALRRTGHRRPTRNRANWPPAYCPGSANPGLWVERGVIWLMPDAVPIGFIDSVSARTFMLPGNLLSKVPASNDPLGNSSPTVGGMPALTVGAARKENVSGATLTIGSPQTENVATGSITVGTARTENISGGATVTVGRAHGNSVGGRII